MSLLRSVLLFVFLLGSCVLEGGVPGPAGGYVFYDKGTYAEGWRYLECAPEDAGELQRAGAGPS
ncbi:MAG: hypothetical protein LBC51_03150 [Treponema sp.]|jgi:hypothetical protein|nr:hypothetical protein [Treponema sp.]